MKFPSIVKPATHLARPWILAGLLLAPPLAADAVPVIGEIDNLYNPHPTDMFDAKTTPINLVGAKARYEWASKALAKNPGAEATKLLQDDIAFKIQKLEALRKQREEAKPKLKEAVDKLAGLKKNKAAEASIVKAEQEVRKCQTDMLEWKRLAQSIVNFFNDKAMPMSEEQLDNITKTW